MPDSAADRPRPRRVHNSFVCAARGIVSATRRERNLRRHWGIALVVLLTGLFFNITPLEWCLLILAATGVLVTELLNTAVEETLDHVTPEEHPAVGRAKDIAAGAVLIAALGAALVGLIVFLPHLGQLLAPSPEKMPRQAARNPADQTTWSPFTEG